MSKRSEGFFTFQAHGKWREGRKVAGVAEGLVGLSPRGAQPLSSPRLRRLQTFSMCPRPLTPIPHGWPSSPPSGQLPPSLSNGPGRRRSPVGRGSARRGGVDRARVELRRLERLHVDVRRQVERLLQRHQVVARVEEAEPRGVRRLVEEERGDVVEEQAVKPVQEVAAPAPAPARPAPTPC